MTSAGCPAGSATVIVAPTPERGAQHPTTVQRKARDHVERSQQQIDAAQIGKGSRQYCKIGEYCSQSTKERGQTQTRQRSGDGDAKLGTSSGRLAPDLGHTAKDEQGDTFDRHLLAQGQNRVAQFMEKHRSKEEYGSNPTYNPVCGRGPPRILLRKVAGGERPRHKNGDQEPAGMQLDRNAQDFAKIQRTLHSGTSFSGFCLLDRLGTIAIWPLTCTKYTTLKGFCQGIV